MVPLQSAPLVALLVVGAVCLLAAPVAFALWVYLDARGHGRSTLDAAFYTALALSGPLALLYLLLVRPRFDSRTRPPTRGERLALCAAVASVGAMVLGATLVPPDPFTQIATYPAFLLLTLPPAAVATVPRLRRRLRTAVR